MASPERSSLLASLFVGHDVCVTTSPVLPAFIDELDAQERGFITSMAPRRQAEFATGRACARLALGDLNISGPVLRAPSRAPVWPEHVTGSISHTRGFCVAAVAPISGELRSIGIDVEQIARLSPRIERRILNDVDREALDSLTEPARQIRVAAIFAAKEAFYKAHHQLDPRFIGFDAVSVAPDGEDCLAFWDGSQGVSDELLGRTSARFVESDGMIIVAVSIVGPR